MFVKHYIETLAEVVSMIIKVVKVVKDKNDVIMILYSLFQRLEKEAFVHGNIEMSNGNIYIRDLYIETSGIYAVKETIAKRLRIFGNASVYEPVTTHEDLVEFIGNSFGLSKNLVRVLLENEFNKRFGLYFFISPTQEYVVEKDGEQDIVVAQKIKSTPYDNPEEIKSTVKFIFIKIMMLLAFFSYIDADEVIAKSKKNIKGVFGARGMNE